MEPVWWCAHYSSVIRIYCRKMLISQSGLYSMHPHKDYTFHTATLTQKFKNGGNPLYHNHMIPVNNSAKGVNFNKFP